MEDFRSRSSSTSVFIDVDNVYKVQSKISNRQRRFSWISTKHDWLITSKDRFVYSSFLWRVFCRSRSHIPHAHAQPSNRLHGGFHVVFRLLRAPLSLTELINSCCTAQTSTHGRSFIFVDSLQAVGSCWRRKRLLRFRVTRVGCEEVRQHFLTWFWFPSHLKNE